MSRLMWGLMGKIIVAVIGFFLFLTTPAAQSEPATWGSTSSGSTAASQQNTSSAASAPQDQPDPKDMERIAFTHRAKPESPPPKKNADEDNACPSGEGNPCALLGGWRYYQDQWHITEHEATWGNAFKTPGVLFSTSALFGSTIVDIEGTQHCLATGTCRELNPIMGKTRAQQYGVAMPMNALLTWAAVHEKQHGRGVLPFFMLWSLSTVHLYYGVNGLMPQGRNP